VLNLTDSGGNSVKSYTYKGFGEIYSETGSLVQPFKFTGREYDPESGLYFYRARYYDPRAGRFLTKDPIGFMGGDVNLYRAMGNNPVNRRDPFGLTSLLFDIKHGILWVDPERPGADIYGIPATSGKGKCINVSKGERDRKTGPIPRGDYTADISQLSNPGWVGDVLRNLLGDWGDWRVPLAPNSGTATFGRSGFFLHGGGSIGSAGCIDIGGGIFGDSNTNRLLRDLLADPDKMVPLQVQ
jgi:RHS repeat-associated protein